MHRWRGSQRRIGITGGIATGKSAAAKYLKEVKKLLILDADVFAKEAISAKKDTIKKIINRFGKEILTGEFINQRLNRKKLAKIIFDNEGERIWLEQLIHPIVNARFKQELEKYKDRESLVLVIPLLFEANLTDICSEIWLINCDSEIQIQRLMRRDMLTRAEAQKRIRTQWPLNKKKALSDKIIDNNYTLKNLFENIEKLL